MHADMDIDKVVAELSRMSVRDLRQRYAEVFGEPPRSFNKPHLVKRIAWRVQALREGDLSERARRRARELANDADLRITPPHVVASVDVAEKTVEATFRTRSDDRLPMPGAMLKREYKGRLIQVRVLPQGFEFDGEVYRSLTAIARKITGSHWNGWHFFGIAKSARRGKEARK